MLKEFAAPQVQDTLNIAGPARGASPRGHALTPEQAGALSR
ncbi:MAG: hypothetical protein ACLRWF_10075 [Ruthenibacterium sp.]